MKPQQPGCCVICLYIIRDGVLITPKTAPVMEIYPRYPSSYQTNQSRYSYQYRGEHCNNNYDIYANVESNPYIPCNLISKTIMHQHDNANNIHLGMLLAYVPNI